MKRDLGKEKIGHLNRPRLIECGRKRADQGAGPVTLGIDIGVIKMILTHAAAVHGLEISPEAVDMARIALKRLGLIGKGIERNRRPATAELNRLFQFFDANTRLTLPMTRIVQFAVATAMRLDEICRVEWSDLDIDRRMLLIRDRKDPRNKAGNDQRIPLFAATGFDAWALVMAQAKHLGKAKGPIFPYNSKSFGTALAAVRIVDATGGGVTGGVTFDAIFMSGNLGRAGGTSPDSALSRPPELILSRQTFSSFLTRLALEASETANAHA